MHFDAGCHYGLPLNFKFLEMIKINLRPLITIGGQTYYVSDVSTTKLGIFIELTPAASIWTFLVFPKQQKQKKVYYKPYKSIFFEDSLKLIKDVKGDFVERFYSVPEDFRKNYQSGQLSSYCNETQYSVPLFLQLNQILKD